MIWQIFWWNWKFEANVEMLWVLYQSPLFFHSSSKVVHFCPPQPKLESQQRHILPLSLWKKSHKRPWKICVCPLKCVNMVSYASLPFQEIKPFWVLLGVGQQLAYFKFTCPIFFCSPCKIWTYSTKTAPCCTANQSPCKSFMYAINSSGELSELTNIISIGSWESFVNS